MYCIIGYSAVTLTLLFMISVVEKKLKAVQELSENFEVSRTLTVIANFSSEKKIRLEVWLFMNLKYAPFPLASLQTLTQPRHTPVLCSRHNTHFIKYSRCHYFIFIPNMLNINVSSI